MIITNKILATIIKQILEEQYKEQLTGWLLNRSTIDHNFILKQILYSCYKLNIPICMLLINCYQGMGVWRNANLYVLGNPYKKQIPGHQTNRLTN